LHGSIRDFGAGPDFKRCRRQFLSRRRTTGASGCPPVAYRLIETTQNSRHLATMDKRYQTLFSHSSPCEGIGKYSRRGRAHARRTYRFSRRRAPERSRYRGRPCGRIDDPERQVSIVTKPITLKDLRMMADLVSMGSYAARGNRAAPDPHSGSPRAGLSSAHRSPGFSHSLYRRGRATRLLEYELPLSSTAGAICMGTNA